MRIVYAMGCRVVAAFSPAIGNFLFFQMEVGRGAARLRRDLWQGSDGLNSCGLVSIYSLWGSSMNDMSSAPLIYDWKKVVDIKITVKKVKRKNIYKSLYYSWKYY